MIRELHEKLINKEITSVELTEKYFDTISQKDGEISAFLTLTKELALEQAKKIDEKIRKGEKIGVLSGIPAAIKDNICIQGTRTTAASRILDNYVAPFNATVISRLEEEGMVVLGKTNMDEFAMGSSTENSGYFPTKNPFDLERVPGGSSGGSAAAVGAGMAVWALGSDTGGSIRQPASFCGVVGLKPTYGRVSRYGLLAMASSLDQIGPIAKTVEDAAIILSAISGRDKMDATTGDTFSKKFEDYLTGEVRGMKIGIVSEYLENLDDEVREIIEKVIEDYKKMGAEICEIELPASRYALPTYYIIQPSEVSSNLARFDGIKYGMRADDHVGNTLLETYLDSRKYGLGKEVKRRIMLGTFTLSSGYYDAYYLKAEKARTLIKKDFEKVFSKVDLILTPTTPTPAFKLGEKTDDPLKMYLEDIFTVTANIVGIPAISVPAGFAEKDGKKLPLGFQLMAKWFDEENLLRAAHAYEINGK